MAIEQDATVIMVGSETQDGQVGTVSLDLTSGDFSASWKPYPNPVEPNPAPIHVSGTVNCVASLGVSGTSLGDFLFVIPQGMYGGTIYVLMTSNNNVPAGFRAIDRAERIASPGESPTATAAIVTTQVD